MQGIAFKTINKICGRAHPDERRRHSIASRKCMRAKERLIEGQGNRYVPEDTA
jgi:hypothetical protein